MANKQWSKRFVFWSFPSICQCTNSHNEWINGRSPKMCFRTLTTGYGRLLDMFINARNDSIGTPQHRGTVQWTNGATSGAMNASRKSKLATFMVGATKVFQQYQLDVPEVEGTLQTSHRLPTTSKSEDSRRKTFLLGFYALMNMSNNQA